MDIDEQALALENRITTFKETHDDFELGIELSALLTQTSQPESETSTLKSVYKAIVDTGTASSMDPLSVLPLLLGSTDQSASDILHLLGECGNAKEVVLAVQESLGILRVEIGANELDGDAMFRRLERLLSLYVSAIPRLKHRSRPASEALKPLFSNLSLVIDSVEASLSRAQAAQILDLISCLLSAAVSWAQTQTDSTDTTAVKSLCRSIYTPVISDLSIAFPVRLARRKFDVCFPRLTRSSAAEESSDGLFEKCLATILELSYTYGRIARDRTSGSLIILSLLLSQQEASNVSTALFEALYPVTTAALQASFALDACLNVLLHVLFPSSPTANATIDPDIIHPLCSSIAPVAASSPDSEIRLIAFRLLGEFISRAPPLERMTLLRDLLSDFPFPAMRVAAIGLLKNNVLEALKPGSAPSPFSSPALLQTFGPIVLRSDPPNVFEKTDRVALGAFVDTQEPRRLVECLSFYYVLLKRDVDNKTGVRDRSQRTSVENDFIKPIRNALDVWSELDGIDDDEETMMALAALDTAIGRIDEAYEQVDHHKLNIRFGETIRASYFTVM